MKAEAIAQRAEPGGAGNRPGNIAEAPSTAPGAASPRILFIISNLEYGGAQRQVVELANALPEQGAAAWIASLSPYVPLASYLKRRSDVLHVLPKRFKYDMTVIPRLARLIRHLHVDVVQSYLFDADIAARLAGTWAGAPLVVGSERNTDYSLKRIQHIFYRLTRGLAHRVIANSEAGARFNQRLLGHHPRQYGVVHNGVDTVRFRPTDQRAAREKLGLPPDAPLVGMFGSFKEQKNHSLLLDAIPLVIQRIPSARFLIVGEELYGGMHGSDAYRERIFHRLKAEDLERHCVFAGNQDDLVPYYNACDATVLPSLFEGTPNVMLESMACGVPVVATDVSDNAFINPDGDTGFIVPLDRPRELADRLARVLEDKVLRHVMGEAARRRVQEEFSIARLASKTLDLYRLWLDERRTPSRGKKG